MPKVRQSSSLAQTPQKTALSLVFVVLLGLDLLLLLLLNRRLRELGSTL